MRNQFICIFAVSLTLLACNPDSPQATALEVSPEQEQSAQTHNLDTQLEAILDRIYQADEPGATVQVSRGGKVIYQAARGMADLELDVAMQADHVLKIGSITKQFTAAGILRLAEQGKLTMQTKVGEILPAFHEPDLTVHQLLNHTSGLPSYTDDSAYMMGNGIRGDVSAAEIIALTSDQPLHFVPGEDWRYSNSGYVVLGAIIEQLTGMSWHAYLAEQLTQPLGFGDTGYFNEAELVRGRVSGYSYEDGFINAPFISMTQPHAAGAFYGTAAELDRWQYALHTGKVLEPDSYAQMIDTSQGLNNYAYALSVRSLRGTPMISHGGGIHGFIAYALWLPEHEVSVVVLTNRMAPGVDAAQTAMRLAAQVIAQPFPIEQAVIEASDETLQALVGTYRVDDDTVRTLYLKAGEFFSKRGDGSADAVKYVGDDRYVLVDSLAYFEVVRDDAGAVQGVNFYQSAAAEPESNQKISAEVRKRQVVELSPNQAQRLVGDYELQPNFVISIRHTEAGITAQATGQPAFLVTASSEDVLFNEEFGIVMEFDLPEQGVATQLHLLQGGQNLPASRKESIATKEDE